jgi:hypothetical protein
MRYQVLAYFGFKFPIFFVGDIGGVCVVTVLLYCIVSSKHQAQCLHTCTGGAGWTVEGVTIFLFLLLGSKRWYAKRRFFVCDIGGFSSVITAGGGLQFSYFFCWGLRNGMVSSGSLWISEDFLLLTFYSKYRRASRQFFVAIDDIGYIPNDYKKTN